MFLPNPIYTSRIVPLQRMIPAARLLTGAILFAACFVAPLTVTGQVFLFSVVVCYALLSGLPLSSARNLIMLGVIMYLPLVILMLVYQGVITSALTTPESPVFDSNTIGIFTRGMSTMFIAVTTLSTMRLMDLHDGLRHLRLPRTLVTLTTQILHQTSIMLEETGRVSRSIQLRGASSNMMTILLIVRSLPLVWLPRMVTKSERVGRTMEARLFGISEPALQGQKISPVDIAGVISSMGMLAISIALRISEFPE
jgi:energy-coupling factor transporter transmembrane protein EcfT